MASVFNIIEHTISGQHIRDSPRGTKYRQEDVLRLCVKQYVPATSSLETDSSTTALTIIGVVGNGFPKVGDLPIQIVFQVSAYASSITIVLILKTGNLRTVFLRAIHFSRKSSSAFTRHLDGRLLQPRCERRAKRACARGREYVKSNPPPSHHDDVYSLI